MKLYRTLGLILAIQLCTVLSAFGQGSYKVEVVDAVPADIPAPLQSAIAAQGVRVANDQGATLCEVWLRKDLPTSSSPNTSSDVMFGTLPEGAFLGILYFPNAATDFRNQAIKAGYYTLRYALIPQDGNHMGVNPSRDAFVLAPASADRDPDKTLSFNDLVKLSRQASGTAHPGFLVGAPATANTFPSIAKDDAGNWNLQIKGHGSGGDVSLGITVVGHWQG